jgi:hypothetical protein
MQKFPQKSSFEWEKYGNMMKKGFEWEKYGKNDLKLGKHELKD